MVDTLSTSNNTCALKKTILFFKVGQQKQWLKCASQHVCNLMLEAFSEVHFFKWNLILKNIFEERLRFHPYVCEESVLVFTLYKEYFKSNVEIK